MKYSLGDKVLYQNEKYVVCGAYETTKLNVVNDPDTKQEVKSATMDIRYDIKNYKNDIIKNVIEPELTLDDVEINDQFEENVEYALRNGLIVTYCSICDTLETDDGIEIPVDLYREDGTCIASNDFDIVNKKELCVSHCTEKTNNVWQHIDGISEEKKDKTKDESGISLKSADGKYGIEVVNSPFGFGIMGELPDNMRSIVKDAIKMIGDRFND